MTMNMNILISSKQGGGKSTTAAAVIEEIMQTLNNTKAHNVIFADTIYQMHHKILDILESKGIPVERKKYGPLLQYLGTEFGRKTDFGPLVGVNPNIWVDCLRGEINNKIKEEPSLSHVFVISDCRFENEFDGLHGFKVRLEAPREVRKARCDGWRDNDTHQSEVDLDQYAKDKKFHLYLNTEVQPVEECVDLILKTASQWVRNELDLENPVGYDKVSHLYT